MVDLHPLQISLSNSLYFAQNRRISVPISAAVRPQFVLFVHDRHCRPRLTGTAGLPGTAGRPSTALPPPSTSFRPLLPQATTPPHPLHCRVAPCSSLTEARTAPAQAKPKPPLTASTPAPLAGPPRLHASRSPSSPPPARSSSRPTRPRPRSPASPGHVPARATFPGPLRASRTSSISSQPPTRKQACSAHPHRQCWPHLTGSTGQATPAVPVSTARQCRCSNFAQF
jgi:hypothetical protein